MKPLLEVEQLTTAFRTDYGEVTSVEGVSFRLQHGETVGIVGESGCGKSVTSLSIMRLLGKNGYIRNGSVSLNGVDLAALPEDKLRSIRGSDIAMIFQDPMTSLNPVFTIGNQLCESIVLHMKLGRKKARQHALEMLKKVGLARPEQILDAYPHELSGGMRQRVMIAMALSCKPKLLIADEPTTALDVTIQAQILHLMRELQKESGTAIMLITHDLGVVAEMADKVIVMYAGQVVEETDVYTLFEKPLHPYTQGLMASVPHLELEGEGELASIPGAVPSLQQMPTGCRFHARCPYAVEQCVSSPPQLTELESGHYVRCWLASAKSMEKEGVSL